jgi:hypothetical protein
VILFFVLSCTTGDSGTGDTDAVWTDIYADNPVTRCYEGPQNCAPGTGCDEAAVPHLPGSNCLSCHTPGNLPNGDDPALIFHVAGTAHADLLGKEPLVGASVRVTGADGVIVAMTTDEAGNFWSTEAVVFPIRAKIYAHPSEIEMPITQPIASCNACHRCGGAAGGPLYGPDALQ